MLRQPASILLLLCALVGCAATPSSQYGHFIAHADASQDQKMADDVVKKLVALYPPAKTTITLQHATTDAFGSALITSIRTKGYALTEFKAEPPASPQASPVAAKVVPPARGTTNLSLAYIVDQARDSDLVRLTLLINTQSLSRVYQVKDGTLNAAGYWVRKE